MRSPALAVARQIAEALEAAHDRIVHRDLKPLTLFSERAHSDQRAAILGPKC
jgi:serine/threonine protein kinase